MEELSEAELNLAMEVFHREWAKLYDVPPHFPLVPLGSAIEAVLRCREQPENIS